jgi:hypothetical protein
MAKSGVQNYVATLVFCILLLVLSILLIGLLLLGIIPMPASFFALTLVFGLILIASIALYSIVNYEKLAKAEADELLKSKLDVITCPDFYTRSNNTLCRNNYESGFYQYNITGGSNIDLSRYINKPVRDVCKAFSEDAFLDGVYIPESNVIPWTYLSSKCDVL